MDIVEYKNYGKCVRFERNEKVLMVTLDIGPRIIYYGTNATNFLNEDLERNVNKSGEYFDANFKKGETWYLYGGHRVWKSPEDLESYTTDNYPVETQMREWGGLFTTRIAKQLDYSIDVEMKEDGSINIQNIITNKSEMDRTLAVWALTVVAKGGTLIIPLNEAHDELNPYQNLVQWPYNDLHDERMFLGKKYLSLKQTNKLEPIKLGIFSEKKRAYYVLNNNALKFEFLCEEGNFADFCCNLETYTNAHILEVEGLSPLRTLKQGDSAILQEKWTLIDDINIPSITDEGLKAFV